MTARRKGNTLKLVGAKSAPSPAAGLVRLGRVAEARRRIASGWYDRAEVRDRLVEAVLQQIRTH